MSTVTPNMNLVVSTIGVDSGLLWEQNLNASLTLIDQHNHSPGYGVQINPSGININATLPMNNNALSTIGSLVFQQQSSLATLNALFVGVDGNLYFNDGAGDPSIQITAGGVVNATASGIASGTATASFVSSVLVVNAAPTLPANIQGASILLGNNSAGSKYLTLSPPPAMAANFNLTLPSLPSVQSYLSIDTSGNIMGYTPVARSTVVSASGGTVSVVSSPTNISGTATIVVTGRPVSISMQPVGGTAEMSLAGGASMVIDLLRDGSSIASWALVATATLVDVNPALTYIDVGATAGTHTYVYRATPLDGVLNVAFLGAVAYEFL